MADDLFSLAVEREVATEQEMALPEPDPTMATDREQEFKAWKDTKGGRHIMRYMHQAASSYGKRYIEEGRRVSVRLILELVRDRLPVLRKMADKDGVLLKDYKGFRINNDFAPYMGDHIESRHPSWEGMFETRARRSRKKPIREMSGQT